MAARSAKPTIYLPVEIKARELKAKVLLSVLATRAGFRVYLGTKRSIDRLVLRKSSRDGIYFYKGGKPLSVLEEIKKKVDSFVVLDEEMGPAIHDLEMYCRRRIYPGTEHLIDGVFVIGDGHKQKLELVRPQLLGRIFASGWPRVDLWRPEFKFQYFHSVESIRSRFGNFILFSSDFGFLSEEKIHSEIERLQSIATSEADLESFSQLAWAAFKDFKDFLDLMRRVDADDAFPPLVIRPHPAEDLSIWDSALSELKKVKVVYEGEISPWLYASSGLLHRGCTTAVQACVAGIPSVYLLGKNSKPKSESFTYKVSTPVSSYEDLLAECDLMFSGEARINELDLSDVISVDSELASSKILSQLQQLETTPAYAFNIGFFLKKFRMLIGYLNEYREMKGWGLERDKLAKAKRKMLGGIHEFEIADAVFCLFPDFSGTVIERDFNLVEIDV
ncbi:surface carbohydrate biosynthesis protein [Pseudomonas xionganensis]|uniref:Surface carbohydrate biosynthesis protein n=1 Tax=Pseudomonas xionganensis TaxID=2654845 RepID=A0A6I4L031_9PSED|nr:surface carbohydrate biosynthesis protein [Pseudomonas xionganensis]MVW76086.1 hypothetical protein [Pseudomonas xionganensis]